MRLLLVGCAALALMAVSMAPRAEAFSVQSVNNVNPDGSEKFADPDQNPLFLGANGNGGPSAGPSVVIKGPNLGGSGDAVGADEGTTGKGSTFSARESRWLFGPFNHFGYGDTWH